MIKKLKKAEL